MTTYYDQVAAATEYLLKCANQMPEAALVLGSGLACLEGLITEPLSIQYSEIPHFPSSNVKGHANRILIGKVHGTQLWVFSGRIHYYEGHTMEKTTFPIRVIGKAGIKTLFLTNAAGSIDERNFKAGELLLISDHINLTGTNPLLGPNEKRWGPRFLDQREVYNRELRDQLQKIATMEGLSLREGIYAGVSGPTYGTPAEVAFLHRVGANAVGMSTVPEAIIAHHMGIKLAALSVISNVAAHHGSGSPPTTHDEVLEAANHAAAQLLKLLNRQFQERETNN